MHLQTQKIEPGNDYELKSAEYLNNCLSVYDRETESEKYDEVLKSYLGRTSVIAARYLENGEYLKCIEVINSLDENFYTEQLKTEFGELNLLKAESYLYLSESENDEQNDNVLNSINCYKDAEGIFGSEEYPQKAAEINRGLGFLYERLYTAGTQNRTF